MCCGFGFEKAEKKTSWNAKHLSYYVIMYITAACREIQSSTRRLCQVIWADWTNVVRGRGVANGQLHYFCSIKIWHPRWKTHFQTDRALDSDYSTPCGGQMTAFDRQKERGCIFLWNKRTDEQKSLKIFHYFRFHLLRSFQLCRDNKKESRKPGQGAKKGNLSREWTFLLT